MKPRTFLLFRLWFAVLCVDAIAAEAATREWVAQGTDSGNWSQPGNWKPTGVPQNGDDLIFKSSAEVPFPRQNMFNDLVDLRVGKFQFCDHGWTLAGNELTLLDEVGRTATATNPCGASSVVFNCPLKLGASTRIEIGWGSIVLRGTIDLNGNYLNLVSGDQIIVSGQITGTGNVFATSDGFIRESTITFDGAAGNTFSGKLTIRGLHREIGRVVFDKQSGVVVNDALLIGDRAFYPTTHPAVCKLARSHQIGDNAEVCVTGGSQFLLEGHTETIGSLCLTNNSGDTEPTLVDTGGATLSVQGDITAVDDAVLVIPTIRGKLGLPSPAPASSAHSAGFQPAVSQGFQSASRGVLRYVDGDPAVQKESKATK